MYLDETENDETEIDEAEVDETETDETDDTEIDENEIEEPEIEETEKNDTIKKFVRLVLKILFLVVIGLIFFKVVFGLKRMETSYMSPYITEGDLLLYYRLDRDFQRGEIVYLKHNNKNYVFRIVAKAGQTVDISELGELIIDGVPEKNKSLYETNKIENSSISYPYKVREGNVFVMNDNRLQLEDSRYFGEIPINEIEGKIIGRLQIRNF